MFTRHETLENMYIYYIEYHGTGRAIYYFSFIIVTVIASSKIQVLLAN